MAPNINSLADRSPTLKKRVLFVITQNEMGGAQKFLLELVRRIDTKRFEYQIALGATGDTQFIRALEAEGITATKLKHLVRPVSPGQDISAVMEVKKLIANYQPDTIFLMSSKAGFVGSAAARLAGRRLRVIYRIGGWTFNDPWPAWKRWVWVGLERVSAGWKDVIIVNNHHDEQQAKQLGITPRELVTTVPNGIDPYQTQLLPRAAARRELGLPEADNLTVVGTIANFYPAKGLEYLISAAEHYTDSPNTLFVIIGDGQERKNLEKLIQDKNLEKKVILAGRHSNAQRLLSALDIFVLPSVKEGFPWAILEAMAAKVPVIATRVGAVPEIIEDGKNGLLVAPGTTKELATAIDTLINNPRLAQDLALAAHQTLVLKYSIHSMVQKIEELL